MKTNCTQVNRNNQEEEREAGDAAEAMDGTERNKAGRNDQRTGQFKKRWWNSGRANVKKKQEKHIKEKKGREQRSRTRRATKKERKEEKIKR